MSHPEASRILIVEDEAKIAALLSDYLVRDGYVIEIVSDGRDVSDVVRRFDPALVLLDLMLPGKDGLEVCREIRSFSQVPVIMVTARVDEIDRLLGLELGADDYICKPFSPREVVARVKTVLRRVRLVVTEPDTYRGVTVDEVRSNARVDGQVLDLTPVEFSHVGSDADTAGPGLFA